MPRTNAPPNRHEPESATASNVATSERSARCWRNRIVSHGAEPPGALTPHPLAWRQHGEAQRAATEASLDQVGWVREVLKNVTSGYLLDGFLRRELGLRRGEREIPVTYVELTEDEERLLLAILDPIAAMAERDEAIFAELVASLENADEGLRTLLDELVSTDVVESHTDAEEEDSYVPSKEETAALLAKWQPAPGQVWTIPSAAAAGRAHRLVCGDATDPKLTTRVIGDDRVALLFTSPPYDRQRDYGSPIKDWTALMQGIVSAAPLAEDTQILVNLGLVHRDGEWHPYWDAWIAWMREQGWRRFGWYVWDQGEGLPGDWGGRLAPSHEFVFHFNRISRQPNKTKPCKHAGKHSGGGLRERDGSIRNRAHWDATVQDYKIPESVVRAVRSKTRGVETGHPAVFSVDLAAEMHTAYAEAGEVVYEPFLGSGTSILAAERTGRLCSGCELEPAYIAIALERLTRAGLEPVQAER